MYTILAQTLSGDWVITRQHSDDPEAETELARFHASTTVPDTDARSFMERAAASAAIYLDLDREGIKVQSHQPDHRARMQGRIIDFGGKVAA